MGTFQQARLVFSPGFLAQSGDRHGRQWVIRQVKPFDLPTEPVPVLLARFRVSNGGDAKPVRKPGQIT
jgi:hypothetical protein